MLNLEVIVKYGAGGRSVLQLQRQRPTVSGVSAVALCPRQLRFGI